MRKFSAYSISIKHAANAWDKRHYFIVIMQSNSHFYIKNKTDGLQMWTLPKISCHCIFCLFYVSRLFMSTPPAGVNIMYHLDNYNPGYTKPQKKRVHWFILIVIFNDRFYLSFYASTIALWKVTFTAIILRNKVVHSVFCIFAIRCMCHCTADQ